MPLITYRLLRKVLSTNEATTEEMLSIFSKKYPRALDTLLINLKILERMGFVEKRFDKRLKTYIWKLKRNNIETSDMLMKYSTLHEQSLYTIDSLSDEVFRSISRTHRRGGNRI